MESGAENGAGDQRNGDRFGLREKIEGGAEMKFSTYRLYGAEVTVMPLKSFELLHPNFYREQKSQGTEYFIDVKSKRAFCRVRQGRFGTQLWFGSRALAKRFFPDCR
jgi:hypothetical protein